MFTEGPRFREDRPETDEPLAERHAYQSPAFGDGLTLHTESGKYSKRLGPGGDDRSGARRNLSACRVCQLLQFKLLHGLPIPSEE